MPPRIRARTESEISFCSRLQLHFARLLILRSVCVLAFARNSPNVRRKPNLTNFQDHAAARWAAPWGLGKEKPIAVQTALCKPITANDAAGADTLRPAKIPAPGLRAGVVGFPGAADRKRSSNHGIIFCLALGQALAAGRFAAAKAAAAATSWDAGAPDVPPGTRAARRSLDAGLAKFLAHRVRGRQSATAAAGTGAALCRY